jgi:branched-chain amino acid transport system substrate-binding protein
MLKKLIPVLVVCSLLVLLIVPGCGGEEEENVIKIGVIGPMQYVQGEHHWYGATMAMEEINAAGGIDVDGTTYTIELIKADSNEMTSPTDAAAAMDKLISVDGAQFVVGGFRTESVFPMIEVAMDYDTIFLGCGAATESLCQLAVEDYDRYKYWFRVTPFNSSKLVSNSLMTLGMAGAIMQQGLGLEGPLQVAILAEQAEWADAMVAAYQAYVPAMLGMEVVGTWRPSATATDLNAELTAIEDSGAHLILTILSGPVGIPYARQLGELEIPVASVGINVEAQKDGFWDATEGYGDYETTLNTYAEGIALTSKTVAFVNEFIQRFGQTPTYNAGTYDAIYLLKEAIESTGTLDADAIVAELEDIDYVGAGGRIVFMGTDTPTPHDVTYGPGYTTGIATQWQDGEMKAVWPNLGVGEWEDVTYEGVVMWQIPDRVIAYYTQQ